MRILLVDDEEELAEPLQRILTSQGYVVDSATTGDRGWELAQAGNYDLLILDWMMPEKSGVEICKTLRQTGYLTPVLMLTAKDTLDDRVEGLDSGADDYLVKPFELRELLARVRALLRRALPPLAPTLEPAKLSYGNLELDRDNQVVYREQIAIALTEREYQLLEYFMLHPNQLLSHDQISQYLWKEEETAPTSNALVAQIKLLRRKIDRDRQTSLINTVYGKGYRFG
ncbi:MULTISPECIES: two-component system response regulator RppA [Pseudanabaena]|uniref:Two component transcriptional regulator, winged helix family n=2 Tax=Pseudanabaena TaxID=1152 RepID=L8MZE8_9CYAN|nr:MULTISPECIES: two-component system response regulator RppA [Pseudanabaena]ELS31860.1 two component transcriptional regulator, winged helix family [Pseudanabaena biceps PCC 7429]MDG3495883.1 response regulator transcription factor [Pseudanabaena catenata USMAC16]